MEKVGGSATQDTALKNISAIKIAAALTTIVHELIILRLTIRWVLFRIPSVGTFLYVFISEIFERQM